MSNDVYDGPGKCRKQCKCGVYLHARSGFCRSCGHEFVAGAKLRFSKVQGNIIETYKEAGRGRKKCPQCDSFVGVRIIQCGCGFDFSGQEKKEKLKHAVDEEVREYAALFGTPHARVILTPNGNPPKAPKSTKREHILEWIEKNVFIGESILFTSALRYRLRQIYGFNTKESNKANKVVNEWFKDIQNTNVIT
jgi:hypothetical protein